MGQAEEPLGHLHSGKSTKNWRWWGTSWDQFTAESACLDKVIFSLLFSFYTPGFVSGLGRCGMFLNMMSPNPMWINMYFTARPGGETDEWKTKISWLAEELAVLSRSKQVELLHFLSKSWLFDPCSVPLAVSSDECHELNIVHSFKPPTNSPSSLSQPSQL